MCLSMQAHMCKQKELKGGEVERLSGKLRADFPAFVFLFMIADFILFCLAPYLLENCWSEAAFGFSGALCVCVTILQMEKWRHRKIKTSTRSCGESLAQPKLRFSFLLLILRRSTSAPPLKLSCSAGF